MSRIGPCPGFYLSHHPRVLISLSRSLHSLKLEITRKIASKSPHPSSTQTQSTHAHKGAGTPLTRTVNVHDASFMQLQHPGAQQSGECLRPCIVCNPSRADECAPPWPKRQKQITHSWIRPSQHTTICSSLKHSNQPSTQLNTGRNELPAALDTHSPTDEPMPYTLRACLATNHLRKLDHQLTQNPAALNTHT